MSYKNFFYFDIETTSKFPTFFDMAMDDPIGKELFVRKYENIKKFESDWNKPIEEIYIEKSPLMPEYGKIICMSFGMFTDNGEKKIMTIAENDEKSTLEKMVKIFNRANSTKRYLCGFNIKYFDLPFIIKKLYKYDIDIPHNLNFIGVKPWEINITDVYDIWKGLSRYGSSLDEVLYDLDIAKIDDHIKGEDIHDLYWEKGEKKLIYQHCESNINKIIQISEKLKL